MIKKGLPVKKAIDTTACGKKIVIGDPKPTADKKKSSKTKACKSSTKSGHVDGIVDTGSKTTHSQLFSRATNSKLNRLKKKKAAAKKKPAAKKKKPKKKSPLTTPSLSPNHRRKPPWPMTSPAKTSPRATLPSPSPRR